MSKLSNSEWEDIIADTTKRVDGDLRWVEDEDHSPAVEFLVDVKSERGWPLKLRGSYNPLVPALSYVLLHQMGGGRVYALDMGKNHKNPDGRYVGEKHKHTWSEAFRDKEAYVPPDITATVTDVVGVWLQFCEEANIRHAGSLAAPPAAQDDLFV